MSDCYFLGVDVGTGSVRAALIRPNGEIVKTSTWPIKKWNPQNDFYEQSSDDIWRSCCRVVKDVSSSVDSTRIRGIGFDATCSLVCIGENDEPLTVSPTGNLEQNVILWMDHRSKVEAEFINLHKPNVLKYVGGKISPEMQTPKLMWLKKHLKSTWDRAKFYFDLVDFLTWKATGDDSRSLCTLVCKWTYVAGEEKENGWDKDYFSLIGLEDLMDNGAIKIGRNVRIPGEKCGLGLKASAAKELGLMTGTCVGAGLIDAHAGGLGLLACTAPEISPSFDTKIGLICGTSTCLMVVSKSSKPVPGIWGPYYSAMVPDMYLNEAGQSVTGKLLSFVVETHPAFAQLKTELSNEGEVYEYLNTLLLKIASSKGLPSPATLTSQLHIWPDFHGNRSPLADPSLLGMISGLSLTCDEKDLACRYLAAVQSLAVSTQITVAYGTKLIVETLRSNGHDTLSTVLLCGGLSKNKLFAQVHADVLGSPVLVPKSPEPVLLGAGILGAVAAEQWHDIKEAIDNMSGPCDIFVPSQADVKYHKKKYTVFLRMVEDQRCYQKIMECDT
ncbi:hypothetical protein RUM43_005309 [Polyplax serrata]|uniref:FGGY carbohydrate kinase domain-containing protein n=1 Tax=Polyplax serrata TaxID=468196 RepID=A0AAN8NZV0_POLSC